MANITALYAGLLACLYTILSLYVIKGRGKYRVGIGSGKNEDLNVRIRMHGNFAEYVPLLLVLLFLNEQTQAGALWLHVMGAAIVLGRILHPVGIYMTVGTSLPRLAGMILTLLSLLVGGARLIFVALK